MIKARGTIGVKEIVILGLSWANLDRLRDGKPIQFDGTPYGFPGEVMIFAGQDEITMAKAVGMQEADPRVIIEPNAP